MTLHTGANCNMPSSRSETGNPTGLNCDVNTDGNSGCGVTAPTSNSYGPSFNANGGGWYAMERTTTFIKVWFWPRNSGSVPSDVRNGGSSVNTGNWVCAIFEIFRDAVLTTWRSQGTPTAFFPNTDCDINSHFGPNNIIINLTLCVHCLSSIPPSSELTRGCSGGDWAGIASIFNGAGCPGDCVCKITPFPS